MNAYTSIVSRADFARVDVTLYGKTLHFDGEGPKGQGMTGNTRYWTYEAQEVTAEVDGQRVKITLVPTFSVDASFVDGNGQLRAGAKLTISVQVKSVKAV